jgi:hypothetical protein
MLHVDVDAAGDLVLRFLANQELKKSRAMEESRVKRMSRIISAIMVMQSPVLLLHEFRTQTS